MENAFNSFETYFESALKAHMFGDRLQTMEELELDQLSEERMDVKRENGETFSFSKYNLSNFTWWSNDAQVRYGSKFPRELERPFNEPSTIGIQLYKVPSI